MKTLNKLLLTGLSILSLNNLYGQEDSFFTDSLNRVYSENLCINLKDKIYHITKKSEEEGIKDLIKICNENYEEAWLYFPEKQIWYEIGIFSTPNSVKPFMPRIKKALEENPDAKELIFYHNHPGEGFDLPSAGDMLGLMSNNLFFQEYKIVSKIITKEGLVEYSLNSKGKEKSLENLNLLEEYWEYQKPEKYNELSRYFNINCIDINSIKN